MNKNQEIRDLPEGGICYFCGPHFGDVTLFEVAKVGHSRARYCGVECDIDTIRGLSTHKDVAIALYFKEAILGHKTDIQNLENEIKDIEREIIRLETLDKSKIRTVPCPIDNLND